jgi:hypothetical protein
MQRQKSNLNCEAGDNTKCVYLRKAVTSVTWLIINDLTRNTIRNKRPRIRYTIDSQ